MADLPLEMLQRGRAADQDFHDDEHLFRRFPGTHYHPEEKLKVGEEAIELPDMSVGREKHGGKPEFLLVNKTQLKKHHPEWGVFQFEVRDIPDRMNHLGQCYSFRPVHVPEKRDYFHSEVRCYDSDQHHLNAKEILPRDLALRWRRILRLRIRVCIPCGPLDQDD
jgi:hypothetical protein